MSVVRKIRSPHTTGDECPRPSTGVFHATLRSAFHDEGTSFNGEMPLAVGPRQPGQSSEPPSDAASARPDTSKAIAVIIETRLPEGNVAHALVACRVETCLDASVRDDMHRHEC